MWVPDVTESDKLYRESHKDRGFSYGISKSCNLFDQENEYISQGQIQNIEKQ